MPSPGLMSITSCLDELPTVKTMGNSCAMVQVCDNRGPTKLRIQKLSKMENGTAAFLSWFVCAFSRRDM